MFKSLKNKLVLYFLFEVINYSFTLQLFLGDCPVYFYERCTHSEAVKFILSIPYKNSTILHDINPLNPYLPEEFNNLIPIKLVIHGYGGLDIDTSTANVTKAYQEVGFNVIIVDWKYLAEIPCYTTAYLNTWYVAQCITILMVNLISLKINPQIIHVVGFSLGAHVAGLAGNNLQITLGNSFYRITGLDPALPFFATLKNDWKLDQTDAHFVDIIHTSAGSLGKIEATGHVDFYVNGGSLQPMCQHRKYPPLCSHLMAGLFFAESIRNSVYEDGKSFIARKCNNVAYYALGFCNSYENLAIMGENSYYLTRGTYFLETALHPPYALGLESLNRRSKDYNYFKQLEQRFKELLKNYKIK